LSSKVKNKNVINNVRGPAVIMPRSSSRPSLRWLDHQYAFGTPSERESTFPRNLVKNHYFTNNSNREFKLLITTIMRPRTGIRLLAEGV